MLGRIITNVATMPALDYMTTHILNPLGMDATVWNTADVPAGELVLGYRWQDETWHAKDLLPSGGDVAAFAGLFTNLADLVRWVALFQSAWPPRDGPDEGILSRASLREMQQVWTMDRLSLEPAHIGRPGQVRAGGYGFDLSIRHNERWASVGHGGGLPGYGSHMRWVPDYGLGAIALANVTYANVHAACTEALDLLIVQSAVAPRCVHPAPALTQARDAINRLRNGWDDALAGELFGDNVFLDTDRARRRREFADLGIRHGRLQPDGELEPENRLRGRWRLLGDRGWRSVWISLSPTVPPRVQAMDIESMLPPSPAMEAAAQALAALIARPTQRALDRLRAPASERTSLWDDVRLANILCGPCTVDEYLGGDGETEARYRLVGGRGPVEVILRLNHRDKLLGATFGPTEST